MTKCPALVAGRGNFAQTLVETAGRAPSKPAVVEACGTTTYESLAARTGAIARALAAAGVRPNDRVAIFLPRGADAAAAFFGVLASAAIAVNVNELLRPRQIEHILRDSGAAVLLTTAALLERLPRALETPGGARVLDAGDVPACGAVEPAPRIEADVAHIIYTSGSTGPPKGVTISHGNLWAGMDAVVAYLGLTGDDRVASLLPLSFDYGLNQLLCCAGTGATLVVETSPVPQRIVRALRTHEVTILAAVPPLWLQLLQVEAFRSEPLPALRVMTNSGGRLPTEAVRQLRRCQPQAYLFLMYGLTEAFRSTYLAPEKVDRKPSSIGAAIPGAEIFVLDDASRPCGPGEVGELVHRGPTVALGYWNAPEATARVFRPNPLCAPGTPDAERVVFSGDLVSRDDEGDLCVVGRRDALIKILGYRVSPDEIVDVLYASGEIVEAIVAAQPDAVRGSRIAAYVVLADGGDLERLKQFSARELPPYMQPGTFEVRPSLGRTPSGKHDATVTARSGHDPL